MAEEKALDQAREAVSKILEFLGIVRVVCVDDEYKDSPTIDDAVAAGAGLSPEQIRSALPEIGEGSLDDPDVRNERIRQGLESLELKDKQGRCERLLAIARITAGDDTDDKADATVLEQLVPKSTLIPLTPKRWRDEGSTFLDQDSEKRTLFLFDQDLSQDEGEPTEGMKIISAVLAKDTTGNRICGLLTHTVTPETEQQRWKELSQEFSVPADRFMVVPKKWLSQDPLVFAQRLKLAALSPDFSRLKAKAAEIMQSAVAVATKRVEEVSIFDLDHIVFRVAGAEGLWEPDMLFRLHSLFSRLEARQQAHAGGGLEAIAKRLRSVSHIPTDSDSLPASTTWAIQRSELYESPDYLNRNHLPVELGDIFTKTGSSSKKVYILLSQPCDLMVRSGGKRQPEATYLTLAEVSLTANAARHIEELDYYANGPGERYFVNLKQVHCVRACVLDLCAFSPTGSATIAIGKDCPDAIRPTWRDRYAHLAAMYQKKVNRLKVLWPENGESEDAKKTKDKIRKAVLSELLDAGLFKGEITDVDGQATVAFNCQRIGRLSRDRAFGLLMAYTSCLSRPGYERDFGKAPSEPRKPVATNTSVLAPEQSGE